MRRRRLSRLFGLRAHRLRPGWRAMAVLGAVLAVIGAGMATVYRWATAAGDPAYTVALAARLLDRPIPLESALDANWNRAVGFGGAPGTRWIELLEPAPAPPLCLSAGFAPGGTATGIDRAIRRLDRAIQRKDRTELERSLTDLARLRPAARGGVADFIVAYNLARGYFAAGDAASAARELEPLVDEHLSEEHVPHATLAEAELRVLEGVVDSGAGARAFYGRLLAGSIAYDRGETAIAISHFRLALNAVNYVIAGRDGSSFTPLGHYEDIEVPLEEPCGPADHRALSSLDGYAALVRAYLAADAFRDPTRIAGEVRRERFELDANDPFAPLLRYAQAWGPVLEDGVISPNFVWAASNLQRVYHYNVRDPDPRLEVARGVLVLRLMDRADWMEALVPHGGGDPCVLLAGIGDDLIDDAHAVAVRRIAGTTSDSALAALAVHAAARAGQTCDADPHIGSAVRSAWLRLGGRFLGGGLAGRYEHHRRGLVEALATGNGSAAATADRIRATLEEAREHLSYFASGRTPPSVSVRIDPAEGAAFVRGWWRAVFTDIALELRDAVRGQGTGAPLELRAVQAGDFLAALNGAIAHAGRRPSELYALREFAQVARADGRMASLRYRLGYRLRSHPVLGPLVFIAIGAALAFGALAVYINWWRFQLLARHRFYAAEAAAREHRDEPWSS